jgi:hypothetical protein
MKRALFLVAVLFLMSNLAWAQAAGTAPSPVADPRAGGNCQLPDLAGLSPGQRAAAAINAGLEMTFVDSPAVPACPATFQCDSIAGCARGMVCAATILGPCCNFGTGVLCCANGGSLVEVQCPCKCTGPLCSSACASSTNVTLNCS